MDPREINAIVMAFANYLYSELSKEDFRIASVMFSELSKNMFALALYRDLTRGT